MFKGCYRRAVSNIYLKIQSRIVFCKCPRKFVYKRSIFFRRKLHAQGLFTFWTRRSGSASRNKKISTTSHSPILPSARNLSLRWYRTQSSTPKILKPHSSLWRCRLVTRSFRLWWKWEKLQISKSYIRSKDWDRNRWIVSRPCLNILKTHITLRSKHRIRQK
jgi:hypothetical protein